MSIQQIRKSVLIAVGIAALGVAGLLAGRLSAGVMPGHSHGDPIMRVFHHLSDALDLTDDQEDRIKEVLKGHAAEIEAQMKASAAARRGLHQSALVEPSDESAIRAAAQKLGSVQGDSALLFARIRKEVEPILTKEQRVKLHEVRERARSKSEATVKSFQSFLESKS